MPISHRFVWLHIFVVACAFSIPRPLSAIPARQKKYADTCCIEPAALLDDISSRISLAHEGERLVMAGLDADDGPAEVRLR